MYLYLSILMHWSIKKQENKQTQNSRIILPWYLHFTTNNLFILLQYILKCFAEAGP